MKNFILSLVLGMSVKVLGFQKIDVNQADLKQIALLEGISDETAAKIIEYRLLHGPFKNFKELLRVPGITPKKFETIKNKIILYDPKSVPKGNPSKKVEQKALTPSMISLKDLEEGMLRKAHLTLDEPRSWIKKSQQSALFPKIGITFDIGRTSTHSGLGQNNSAQRFSSRNGDDIGVSFQATFELPKLIFNDSMLHIEKLLLSKQENKQTMIKVLHGHYFDFFKLYDSLVIAKNSEEAFALKQELIKLQALLDSLTDQEFGRKLREQEVIL